MNTTNTTPSPSPSPSPRFPTLWAFLAYIATLWLRFAGTGDHAKASRVLRLYPLPFRAYVALRQCWSSSAYGDRLNLYVERAQVMPLSVFSVDTVELLQAMRRRMEQLEGTALAIHRGDVQPVTLSVMREQVSYVLTHLTLLDHHLTALAASSAPEVRQVMERWAGMSDLSQAISDELDAVRADIDEAKDTTKALESLLSVVQEVGGK